MRLWLSHAYLRLVFCHRDQSTSPRPFRKAALPATPSKGSTTPAGDILLEGEKKFFFLRPQAVPPFCLIDVRSKTCEEMFAVKLVNINAVGL
jgi:hypothetical protein